MTIFKLLSLTPTSSLQICNASGHPHDWCKSALQYVSQGLKFEIQDALDAKDDGQEMTEAFFDLFEQVEGELEGMGPDTHYFGFESGGALGWWPVEKTRKKKIKVQWVEKMYYEAWIEVEDESQKKIREELQDLESGFVDDCYSGTDGVEEIKILERESEVASE